MADAHFIVALLEAAAKNVKVRPACPPPGIWDSGSCRSTEPELLLALWAEAHRRDCPPKREQDGAAAAAARSLLIMKGCF